MPYKVLTYALETTNEPFIFQEWKEAIDRASQIKAKRPDTVVVHVVKCDGMGREFD